MLSVERPKSLTPSTRLIVLFTILTALSILIGLTAYSHGYVTFSIVAVPLPSAMTYLEISSLQSSTPSVSLSPSPALSKNSSHSLNTIQSSKLSSSSSSSSSSIKATSKKSSKSFNTTHSSKLSSSLSSEGEEGEQWTPLPSFSAEKFDDISGLFQQEAVDCSALFAGDQSRIKRAVAISKVLAAVEEKLYTGDDDSQQERLETYAKVMELKPDVRKLYWKFQRLTNAWYMNATRDCAGFKHSRGYIESPLTREEEEFPMAFSMLVFKDLEMVERILRAVYRPQNTYCIHVDSKADDNFYSALRAVVTCLPDNVRMSSRRVDVQWGTFTVLEPELICMQDLWDMDRENNVTGENRDTVGNTAGENRDRERNTAGENSDRERNTAGENRGRERNTLVESRDLDKEKNITKTKRGLEKDGNTTRKKRRKWKYFINLTGQEFPLKTNSELVKILKAYRGANMEKGTRRASTEILNGIDKRIHLIRAYTERWPSQAPHGIIPTKGAVHTVLNRATVDYILHSQIAKDFIEWLKTTAIPDETLFASINFNPQLNIPGTYNGSDMEDIVMMNRVTDWAGNKCYSRQRVRQICILSTGDLPRLGSAPQLFANKFYLHQDPIVIGCLEENIFNDTREEYLGTKTFNTSFYAQQDFVLHQVPGDSFR